MKTIIFTGKVGGLDVSMKEAERVQRREPEHDLRSIPTDFRLGQPAAVAAETTTSATSMVMAALDVRRELLRSTHLVTVLAAPVPPVVVPSCLVFLACDILERFRARDDFNEFGGDRSLTGAIVDDGELVDQLARVARRVVHRGH